MSIPTRKAVGLLGCLVLLAGCGGGNPSSVRVGQAIVKEGPPNFDSLPVAAPGQLSGSIVYLTPGPACQWRSYDLDTGHDVLLSAQLSCDTTYPQLLSPDGKLLVATSEIRKPKFAAQMNVVGQDGRIEPVGPPLDRTNTQPPKFMFTPAFSSDSSKVSLCTYPRKHFVALIADTASGKIVSQVPGSCNVAFTQRGLAVLRGGKLMLGGRVLGRFGSNWINRIGANQVGSLLVVFQRSKARGSNPARFQVTVVTLDGRVAGRFHNKLRNVPIAPIQLSPSGRSLFVWWGCIQQLVPLSSKTHRFGLRFGESGPQLSRPAFSPDGKNAVMGRTEFGLPPMSEGRAPLKTVDAVVLDADSFDPLYRLPFAAQFVVWVSAA